MNLLDTDIDLADELSSSAIHLWVLQVSDVNQIHLPADNSLWLGEAERQRLDRLKLDRHKQHYLLGQVFLRKVLSCYGNERPQDWRFQTNDYGKPALSGTSSYQGLEFNLSHSHNAYLLALSRNIEIGADIEFSQRQRRIERIAARHFSRREVNALLTLPESAQLDRFYALWTLKEAYIKARGMGLAISLQRFGFELSFNDSSVLSFWIEESLNDSAERWQFWQIEAIENYAMALAVSKASEKSVNNIRAFKTDNLENVSELSIEVIRSC